jgi:phospholipase C
VTFSDHPPANLSQGMAFVASVVDAVEESPEWSSTAVFLSWDDYGGFYDNVAPPSIDPLGLSLRVPLIVISPYTPAGYVSDSLGYFESLLHFVEWRFNLGCITHRDCTAPLPLQYFDFHMTPRAPVLFPTNWTNASYPFLANPYGVDSFAHAGSSRYAIDPSEWNTGPPPAGLSEDDID